jgi:YD repeat-containing protein
MKVSPERIFKSHHPRCRVERHKPRFEAAYFLIRRRDEQGWRFMYDGEGATPAKAWKDACERLGLAELKAS